MAKDDYAAGANQPHDSADWRRNEAHGDGDDIETRVELRGGDAGLTDLEICAVESANQVHASHDKNDIEEEPGVGEKGIDAEHDKDDSIVAGEVAQIVVNAGLRLGEVGRFGYALDVEKLRDGAEVREAVRHGGAAKAREAVAQVEPGRQGVEGNLDTRHGCEVELVVGVVGCIEEVCRYGGCRVFRSIKAVDSRIC